MNLSYNQLLCDLQKAYLKARIHKRHRAYQLNFQAELNRNLHELADELWSRTYKPMPSTCFVINDPKKREIMAAHFRDRIVHHLFFDYVYPMFLNTFISDSYSCISGRGTHFGIKRLQHHIRSCSHNYSQDCYVMKMDIRGYFMHIRRDLLLDFCLDTYSRMRSHRNRETNLAWDELLDFDFITYLTKVIVCHNPIEGCIMRGRKSDWDDLPHDKSLFHSPAGCGLPIGNLTSQLFSNVYLNLLDQYVKRVLGAKYYGRYVDDFYIVSGSKAELRAYIPQICDFLENKLSLKLHAGKLRIVNAKHGVEFLGAFIKPWRTYLSNSTLHRILPKIYKQIENSSAERLEHSINSYLGVFKHHASLRQRRGIFLNRKLIRRGCLNRFVTKFEHY